MTGRARRGYTIIESGERTEPFRKGERWMLVRLDEDGKSYRLFVSRGSRVRIAFKPRGPEGWGFHWYGRVIEVATGREVWHDRVLKSIGALGMLEAAGLLFPARRFVGYASCLVCREVIRADFRSPAWIPLALEEHARISKHPAHAKEKRLTDEERRALLLAAMNSTPAAGATGGLPSGGT